MVSTNHIAQRIESHQLPIIATEYTAHIEMRPYGIQYRQQYIHPYNVTQNDAEYH